MNDFVVQFFEDKDSINFQKIYGINDKADFAQCLNLEEEVFTVKILYNENRKKLLKNIITSEKVKQLLSFLEKSFDLMWQRLFYGFPPIQIKREYIQGLVGNDDSKVLKYSQEQIAEYTEKFVWDRIRR